MMVHRYYLLLERGDNGGDAWSGELVAQLSYQKASVYWMWVLVIGL